MQLKEFKIRNYRSCQLTTFQPSSGLTALIGINGSGKSNLLSALLLLKRSSRSSMRSYHMIEEEYVNRSHVNVTVIYEGKDINIRGDVYYLTNDRNIDDVVGTNLKWNLQSITGKSSWIELPIEMLMHGRDFPVVISHGGKRLSYSEMARGGWYGAREMKNLLPENVFPVVRCIAQYFMSISYYSASQFSDPSRCPVSLELEDEKPTMRHRRDSIDHEQFILDLYRSYKGKTKTFKKYESVAGPDGIGLVDKINFEEIRLPSKIVKVRSGGKTENKEKTKLVVVPTFTVDGITLSPNQLSEGSFKTLALLFYVITDDSQLLLVEEPEVCIHHGLLNSLVTLIKNESKEKQIIISTHSDFVLDQLEPENVVLVERKIDKGTKAKAVNKALSKTDFKALKEYLENSGNLGEYWREGGLIDE